MIGNLKVFLGKEHINVYAEWLRTSASPRSRAPSCCGACASG